jgi:hypothetical protein
VSDVQSLKTTIMARILATDLADADMDLVIQALAELAGGAAAKRNQEQPLGDQRLTDTLDAVRRGYAQRRQVIVAPPGFRVGG